MAFFTASHSTSLIIFGIGLFSAVLRSVFLIKQIKFFIMYI